MLIYIFPHRQNLALGRIRTDRDLFSAQVENFRRIIAASEKNGASISYLSGSTEIYPISLNRHLVF
jgi:hypothetical protein